MLTVIEKRERKRKLEWEKIARVESLRSGGTLYYEDGDVELMQKARINTLILFFVMLIIGVASLIAFFLIICNQSWIEESGPLAATLLMLTFTAAIPLASCWILLDVTIMANSRALRKAKSRRAKRK